MEVLTGHLDVYWEGMRRTVELTVVSFALAMVVGTFVASLRVSPVPPLRWASTTYIEIVRNTPLLVSMVLFFFGFPSIGIKFAPLTSGIIVLTTYTATFVAETVRSGINAVSKGQGEAARAIGLTYPQTLRIVVIPQALRTVVAPLGGIFIALLKNSALVAAIGVVELTGATERVLTESVRPIPSFVGGAIAYLLLTFPSGIATGWLERRLAIKR